MVQMTKMSRCAINPRFSRNQETEYKDEIRTG